MPVSVRLEKERCKGCTNCVKACPTEAIRVRYGAATILGDKCVDCGQCVRVCPHQAMKPAADSLDRMGDFKYNIVLPTPALYAQFRNLESADRVIAALLELGFDDVYEVAAAAEILSALTKRDLDGCAKPVISTSCPAVTRLIQGRFQDLLPNLSVHISPEELAARLARDRAVEKTGLKNEDIGVFLISSCPAKVTEARYPPGLDEPVTNCVLPMDDIYLKLLKIMPNVTPAETRTAGADGLGWAAAGGEVKPLKNYNAVSCDGMDEVIRLLEEVEDEKFPEIEYLELKACTMGCLGGCMTVENPFAARARFRRLKSGGAGEPLEITDEIAARARRDRDIQCAPDEILDADIGKAIEKFRKIEELKASLPGLDCGSCGAPGCAALAQDVVTGLAEESYCVFNAKGSYLPPPFRRKR